MTWPRLGLSSPCSASRANQLRPAESAERLGLPQGTQAPAAGAFLRPGAFSPALSEHKIHVQRFLFYLETNSLGICFSKVGKGWKQETDGQAGALTDWGAVSENVWSPLTAFSWTPGHGVSPLISLWAGSRHQCLRFSI